MCTNMPDICHRCRWQVALCVRVRDRRVCWTASRDVVVGPNQNSSTLLSRVQTAVGHLSDQLHRIHCRHTGHWGTAVTCLSCLTGRESRFWRKSAKRLVLLLLVSLLLKKQLIKVTLSRNKNVVGAVYNVSKCATDALDTVPVSDRLR